jgi:hypothetical protein
MEYLGNGLFKCPACGDENNLHEIIFNMTIKIERKKYEDDDDTYIEATIIDPYDERLNQVTQEGKDGNQMLMLKDDIEDAWREDGFFDDHELGTFKMDFLYRPYSTYYPECGTEYDLDMEIIIEERIDNWECIDAYKVYGYEVGMRLTDREMRRTFLWRRTQKQVERMKAGTVLYMDHFVARLVFVKLMSPLQFRMFSYAYKHSFRWGYGLTSHYILLPNFSRINKQPKKIVEALTKMMIKDVPEDVNHEILHKVLHEVIGYEATNKFDRIDREKEDGKYTGKYRISCVG